MSVTVYMATHKKLNNKMPPYDYIKPIHVGAYSCVKPFYCLTDNVGDNISIKNKRYCELTALYWMWKNSSDKYLGLCHYRRFFDMSKDEIVSVLKRKKIVVPKIARLGRSLEKQYLHNHCKEPWESLQQILKIKYPDYYTTSKTVFNNNLMYPYNMFIAQKNWLNKYCDWLFDILFEVEKQVCLKTKNDYQIRYPGFLSERLFTLYVFHNNIEVEECNVFDGIKKVLSPSCFRKVRNDIFYKIFGGAK